MKKIFQAFLLVLALTYVVLVTDGDIPIPGVQGCAPGLWYPESHICCMPTEFCPAEGPIG